MHRTRRRAATAAVCALLLAAVLAAYAPVAGNGFLPWDDDSYLTGNAEVRRGLSWAGIRWAFGGFRHANWHPLTWLSHMADVSLFGMEAGRHHLMNAAFHAANAVLLFLLLAGLTGARAPAALVAALFALHPLHVESVAWAAERKDVLSALLFLLALLAYVRHAARPGAGRMAAVAALFALGFMAKPTVLTLPFVLLLLDWWPLGRLGRGTAARLVLEKAPLFVLAAAGSLVTYLAQQSGGALSVINAGPLGVRLGNALVSYVEYLAKAAWPAHLAVFYPHPMGTLPRWHAVAAGLLLAALTATAARLARTRPWLAVGWLWFLGTLVPVIGIVQVGSQAMADRYTYLPLTGVFLALAWEGAARARRPRLRPLLAVGACTLLLALGARTFTQARLWRDGVTLFSASLAATRENWGAHFFLAVALEEEGREEEAEQHYLESLRIHPRNALARSNLGALLAKAGRVGEAIPHFEAAVQARPDNAALHYNLGLALEMAGRLQGAAAHYREAARLDPQDPDAREKLRLLSGAASAK